MENGNKINIWSVVVLIVSIMFFASGIVFGMIKESAATSIVDIRLEVKTTTARVDILERQAAVLNNELSHINNKLDEIKEKLK